MKQRKLYQQNKKSVFFSLGLLMIFTFLLSFNVQGQNVYYASPSGTNSWIQSLSKSTPCNLLVAAANATAGDVVYLLDGRYTGVGSGRRDRSGFNFTGNATKANPILVQSLSGNPEDVILTIASGRGGPVIGQASHNGLFIKGVTILEGPTFLEDCGTVAFLGCTGGKMENCIIKGRDRNQGDNHCGVRLEGSSDIHITNCIIDGYQNTAKQSDHNNCGTQVYRVKNLILENSTIMNCSSGSFDKKGGTNSIYRNNLYINNSNHILVQSTSGYSNNIDTQIYNNVFVGGGRHSGIEIGMQSKNMKIFNNTFYNVDSPTTEYAAIVSSNNGSTTNINIWNNIFHSCNRNIRYMNKSTISYCDNNQFYNSGSAPFTEGWNAIKLSDWDLDAHAITSNPNFNKVSGEASKDYQRSSYPTNGRGGSYESVLGAWISDNNPTQIGYIKPTDSSLSSTSPSEDLTIAKINAYPNPTKDKLTISGTSDHLKINQGIAQIELYTFTGEKLYRTSKVSLPHQIDLSAYQTGIYILKVKIGDSYVVQKIVKE